MNLQQIKALVAEDLFVKTSRIYEILHILGDKQLELHCNAYLPINTSIVFKRGDIMYIVCISKYGYTLDVSNVDTEEDITYIRHIDSVDKLVEHINENDGSTTLKDDYISPIRDLYGAYLIVKDGEVDKSRTLSKGLKLTSLDINDLIGTIKNKLIIIEEQSNATHYYNGEIIKTIHGDNKTFNKVGK